MSGAALKTPTNNNWPKIYAKIKTRTWTWTWAYSCSNCTLESSLEVRDAIVNTSESNWIVWAKKLAIVFGIFVRQLISLFGSTCHKSSFWLLHWLVYTYIWIEPWTESINNENSKSVVSYLEKPKIAISFTI